MRRVLASLFLLVPAPGLAQRLGYEDVLGAGPQVRTLAYDAVEIAAAPPTRAPDRPVEEPDGPVRAFYGDRLEIGPEGNGYSWDVSAEIGSAGHRLWLATAGDALVGGGLDYVEAMALYSRPVSDAGLALQAGVRRDFVRPRRTYAVLGLQGNLSTPLYVGAFSFLSTQGEVSGRLFSYYDWEPLPRVVLQPYAGMELSAQDVAVLGIGRGITETELGLRLRYRIAEPFAPYVGLSWDRLAGRTARIARAAGEDVGGTHLVLGVRSYF